MKLIKIGEQRIEVSPNPFNTYTIITVPEDILRPFSLELFNNEGHKVLSQTNIISNKFILGGKNLEMGTYFCKVFNFDLSYLFTGKIIVN